MLTIVILFKVRRMTFGKILNSVVLGILTKETK